LLSRGKRVFVFDEPNKNRASVIAAGLFNPITGKRMTKSWRAKEIFSYLFKFYEKAEVSLGRNFFHPQLIYRPFISIEEQNEWMSISAEEAVKGFIKQIFTVPSFHQSNDPYGGILIEQSGYLDVKSFMTATQNLLIKENSYLNNYFDVSSLTVNENAIKYSITSEIEIEASGLIFCDGLAANRNPFFNWIPIRPLKGETLTVSLTEKPKVIFNRGVYIVPTEKENYYTVGATYQPNDLKASETQGAKEELEVKLKALINIPFHISHQNWGIRPTTPDRRPVIGAHPIHKNIITFNGLGTKGVSLAPYFSSVLVDWLEGNSEIPIEANIDRFKALYSSLSSLQI
jgi:glycine/D-amino acid oxidase-like deaminating enzyme